MSSTFFRKELKSHRVVRLFVVVVSVSVVLAWTAHRLNRPASYAMRPGMTMEEVRSLLGDPQGVFADKDRVDWYYHRNEEVRLVFFENRLSHSGEKGHPLNSRYRRSP